MLTKKERDNLIGALVNTQKKLSKYEDKHVNREVDFDLTDIIFEFQDIILDFLDIPPEEMPLKEGGVFNRFPFLILMNFYNNDEMKLEEVMQELLKMELEVISLNMEYLK